MSLYEKILKQQESIIKEQYKAIVNSAEESATIALNNQATNDIEVTKKMSEKIGEDIDNYVLYGSLPPRYSTSLFPNGGPKFKEPEIPEELKKATIISWKEDPSTKTMVAKIKITFGSEMKVDKRAYLDLGQEYFEGIALKSISKDYAVLDKKKIDILSGIVTDLYYVAREFETHFPILKSHTYKGIPIPEFVHRTAEALSLLKRGI